MTQKDDQKVSSPRVLPVAELPRKPSASAGRRAKARKDATQQGSQSKSLGKVKVERKAAKA
jgi:hypothetical protein